MKQFYVRESQLTTSLINTNNALRQSGLALQNERAALNQERSVTAQRNLEMQRIQAAYQESEAARARTDNALQEVTHEVSAKAAAFEQEARAHKMTADNLEQQWQMLHRLSSLLEATHDAGDVQIKVEDMLASETAMKNHLRSLEDDLESKKERMLFLEVELETLQRSREPRRSSRTTSLRCHSVMGTESTLFPMEDVKD